MAPIQPQSLLTLATIHTCVAILLIGIAWMCLLPKVRLYISLVLGTIWLVLLIGMLDNSAGNSGFINWFLDPTGDNNFIAMLNSVLLLMTGVASCILFWQSLSKHPAWHRFYWLLLALLFIFLALDEYYSLHESVIFWRGGYIILGGFVGSMTLVFLARSEQSYRQTMFLFLVGLGVMGVGGIVMDAFSAQNLLDIGSLKFPMLSCRQSFLAVNCRDYNFTEELLEIFGAALMAISLWTMLRLHGISKNPGQQMLAAAALWLSVLIAWLWILPTIEAQGAIQAEAEYGEFSLVAYSISADTIEAGDTLDVTIYMRANQFLNADYSLSVHLYTQPDTQSIAQDDMRLGEFVYPTRGWLPFVPIRNRFQLQIPEPLATNQSYQLVMILWQKSPENVINVITTPLKTLEEGRILVLDGIAAPTEEPAAAPDVPVYEFSGGIYLVAYELPESVETGETIQLGFWWRTDEAQSIAMTQFLHWFHIETGEYVIFDQTPFAGRFPIQDWPAGLFAQDNWELTLPADMPVGEYRLQTGLFRRDNQERLAANTAQGQAVQDNSIVLGRVTVDE